MTLFQILAIAALSLVVVVELIRLREGRRTGWAWLVRTAVWLAAGLAICQPLLLQRLATLLGIGRGADVLLYALVFVFLGTAFFLYSRTVLLQRQVTLLIRRYALDNAQRRS